MASAAKLVPAERGRLSQAGMLDSEADEILERVRSQVALEEIRLTAHAHAEMVEEGITFDCCLGAFRADFGELSGTPAWPLVFNRRSYGISFDRYM